MGIGSQGEMFETMKKWVKSPFKSATPAKQEWTKDEITRVLDLCQIQPQKTLLLNDPIVVAFLLSMINPTNDGIWDEKLLPSIDGWNTKMAQLYSMYLYMSMFNDSEKASQYRNQCLSHYKEIELVNNLYNQIQRCTQVFNTEKTPGLFQSCFTLGIGGIHRNRVLFNNNPGVAARRQQLTVFVLNLHQTHDISTVLCKSFVNQEEDASVIIQLIHLPLTIVGTGGNWKKPHDLVCSTTNEVAKYSPVNGSTNEFWMLKRV